MLSFLEGQAFNLVGALHINYRLFYSVTLLFIIAEDILCCQNSARGNRIRFF